MSWLSKIQNEPQKQKIRLLWTLIIVCGVVLIVFWIIIGNYNPHGKKDYSFFNAIGSALGNFGRQDFKAQLQQAQDKAKQQINQQQPTATQPSTTNQPNTQ